MNKKLKSFLEVLAVLVITFIVALTSVFNPWMNNAMTPAQEDILNIAHSVREGFLAYTDLGGNYGPVIYEFYGLGYLLTDTHIVHFIMELVMVFFATLYMYKTAKLYTSEIFAMASAAILVIFGLGDLSSAGAEEIMFLFCTLTAYHVTRQLKYGFLSYHTYLLAIDTGIMFFIQPGYTILWFVIILFFAIMFMVIDLENNEYKAFWMSLLEGFVTVGVPMALYLWYFRNGSDFLKQVVAYNFKNIGGLAEGLKIIIATPWSILILVLLLVIIIKTIKGDSIMDLCCWLGLIAVAIFVIAIQGDVSVHSIELLKAFYIVPLASAFSLVDKQLGLSAEERKF